MPDLVLRERLVILESALRRVEAVLEELKRARRLRADTTATEMLPLVTDAKRDWNRANAALDACSDDLTEARAAFNDLKRTLDALAAIRPRVSANVRLDLPGTNGLLERVRKERASVEKLQRQIAHASGADATTDTQEWWARLTAASEVARGLYRDYLDLLRGVALRDSELDNRLFEVADRLVEVVQTSSYIWSSITVPASADLSDETAASLIRIGFPEWSVWSLPLAGAGYGRMLVSQLARPTELRTEVARASGLSEVLVGSLIAEGFAACRIGPAYAWSTLLMRVDPSLRPAREANWLPRPPASPPSDPSRLDAELLRMSVVIDVLRRYVPESSSLNLSSLEREWSDVLGRAHPAVDLPQRASELRVIAELLNDGVWDLFSPLLGTFEDWHHVDSLADIIRGGRTVDDLTTRLAEARFQPTLLHVLNASWAARLKGGTETSELASRTLELCLVVMTKPSDRPTPTASVQNAAV